MKHIHFLSRKPEQAQINYNSIGGILIAMLLGQAEIRRISAEENIPKGAARLIFWGDFLNGEYKE